MERSERRVASISTLVPHPDRLPPEDCADAGAPAEKLQPSTQSEDPLPPATLEAISERGLVD